MTVSVSASATPPAARASPPAAELLRMLATLAWVAATAALLLGALGTLPGRIVGEARGVRRAATVEEAERRAGAALYLPAYFPQRLAWPPSEVRLARGRGGTVRLVFAARDPAESRVTLLQTTAAGEELAPELLGDRRVLHASRTKVGARPAEIANVLVDGEPWRELSWQIDGRALLLRSRGDVDELYRMAHSARREGR
jgi:hypothetical protein